MNFKNLIKKYSLIYKFISFFINYRWTIRKLFNYKIIDRNYLSFHVDRYSYNEYVGNESISFFNPLPFNDTIPDQIKKYLGKTYELPPSFFNVFEYANLVGPNAVGITKSDNIILDSINGEITLLDASSPREFANRSKLDVENEFDVALTLVSPYNNGYQNNYLHWITEGLFQIEVADHYHKLYGIKPKLIINSNPKNYQVESLQLLGYEPEDCIQWTFSRVIIKKLIVPSMRRVRFDSNEIIFPSAVKWIRNKIIPKQNNIDEMNEIPRNIIISRQNTYGRKIINFDDVMILLNNYDFSIYELENMKFSDQIKLFFNANTIIGAHGAGLSNIMFCSKSNILEIFGKPPSSYSEYFRIANMLNLNYGYMFSDYLYDNYEKSPGINYKEHDLLVDIGVLQSIINKYI